MDFPGHTYYKPTAHSQSPIMSGGGVISGRPTPYLKPPALNLAPCRPRRSCSGADAARRNAACRVVGVQGREVDGVACAGDERGDGAVAGHAGGQECDAPYGGVGRPQPLHLPPRRRLHTKNLPKNRPPAHVKLTCGLPAACGMIGR